jgi:hypothetical protein
VAEDLLRLTHFDSDVRFLHQADERAFFEWLERIPCVGSFQGDDDLRQLLALLFRYGAKLDQLAKFETDENRGWFRQPENYWHDAVFGGVGKS